MEKLKLELNVSEAGALYRALKNSSPNDIIDEHIIKDIMAKIKKYMDGDC